MTLNSNLRYRVVGIGWDLAQPQSLRGVSCGHTWKGFAWGICPRCGDKPAEVVGKYHWLDRRTKQPVPYKSGDAAQFDSLDEAISAFVEGKLTAERNEVLA